jgi:hypothetical protein
VDSEQFVNKQFSLNDKGICVLALLRNRLVERDFSNGFSEYVPRLDNQEKRNMDLLQLLVMPVPTEASAEMAELAICLESRFPGPLFRTRKGTAQGVCRRGRVCLRPCP